MNLKNKARPTIIVLMFLFIQNVTANDSNIQVQCAKNTGTRLHPGANNPGIKCAHLVAGDGMVTMADDTKKELYVFSYAFLPEDDPLKPPENTSEYAGWVMEKGLLAANIPAPMLALDEDDEFFLTLTNVGMAMRPDLFDPHTIHWHGFPEAASIFDGVPDSSISVNMGASQTYYYNVKDPGTYLYHCHVEATEHMQMGMMGSLYVRARQNKLPDNTDLNGYTHRAGDMYVYNDNDGSTRYDVEYPIQIMTFDPDFHDASLNVQPLPFGGMRDRYFLLNGRGYPDTTNPDVLTTIDPLGNEQRSQQESSLILAAPGERILLRISNVSITEFVTLGTMGLTMEVVGLDAKLLRDDSGNNMYYKTNSITLGGGATADVIITAPVTAGTYFLYTKNLDQLANDAENFGGMMTEIRIQ